MCYNILFDFFRSLSPDIEWRVEELSAEKFAKPKVQEQKRAGIARDGTIYIDGFPFPVKYDREWMPNFLKVYRYLQEVRHLDGVRIAGFLCDLLPLDM